MNEWKQLISRANELYFSGQWHAAERLYCKALEVAERQLVYCRDRQDAVAAFISSHRNLADFYQNSNQTYEACLHLKTAHQYILSLAHNRSCCVELRRAARQSAETSYQQLLEFCRQHHLPVQDIRQSYKYK